MATNRRSQVGYGFSEALPKLFAAPIVATRNPTTRDRAEVGQTWVNTSTNVVFTLTSITGGVVTWTDTAGGAGVFTSLTVNPGPFTMAGAGGYSIDSTIASSVTTTGAGIDLTLASLGGSIVIDGSEAVATAVSITASSLIGGITLDSGDGGTTNTTTGKFVVTADSATVDAISLTATDAGAGGVLIDGSTYLELATTNDDGNVAIQALANNIAGVAATLNAYVGVSTHTGLTTAAGATEVLTITCNKVVATSGVLVTVANTGGNDAQMTVTRVIPAAGSFTVTLTNNGAAALNGDVIVTFISLN